jgi:hypothetical protein
LVVVALVRVVLARLVVPEMFKFVLVTEVPTAVAKVKALARLRFVPVAFVKVTAPRLVRPETLRFVLVTLVPTAVPNVMLVRLALVEVRLVVLMLLGAKFEAAKVVNEAFVVVILVPLAVEKERPVEATF